MRRTVLVIPCYNEASRLDVEAFASAARDPELGFLFADDGSTDATAEVLEHIRGVLPAGSATILRLSPNGGKAEAVRRGISEALEHLKDETAAVGFWDADLATPLSEVGRLREVLDERPRVHAVFGSRVSMLGRRIERRALRHYTGRVFATLASLVVDMPVYDSQCGAKLFRCGETTRQVFSRPFTTRWAFDVEVLARIATQHMPFSASDGPVVEVPLGHWHDVSGSKIGMSDLPGMLMDLWRIYRTYGRALRK